MPSYCDYLALMWQQELSDSFRRVFSAERMVHLINYRLNDGYLVGTGTSLVLLPISALG